MSYAGIGSPDKPVHSHSLTRFFITESIDSQGHIGKHRITLSIGTEA